MDFYVIRNAPNAILWYPDRPEIDRPDNVLLLQNVLSPIGGGDKVVSREGTKSSPGDIKVQSRLPETVLPPVRRN